MPTSQIYQVKVASSSHQQHAYPTICITGDARLYIINMFVSYMTLPILESYYLLAFI
jgi:hypothetical protein